MHVLKTPQVLIVSYMFLDSKTKKRKETSFIPDDPEPWVIRGGICGEMQVNALPTFGDIVNSVAKDVVHAVTVLLIS